MVTPLKVGCQVDEEHKKLTENTPYQVIPPNKFPDYRAAFDGPLSWTRPKKLEFDRKFLKKNIFHMNFSKTVFIFAF
jgi:hypothetical protein